MRPSSKKIVLTLTSLTLIAATNVAPAQRGYQRFWAERFKKMEAPEIIEDEAEPRALEKERYLFQNSRSEMISATVFPGDTSNPSGVGTLAELSPYTDASLSLEMGNAARALRAFETALKKEPDNVWIKLRLAQTSIMLNDLSRGQSILEDILKTDPANFRALLLMGELKLDKREFNEAKEWFRKVLKERPGNVEALQTLTQIAFEIDRDMAETKRLADQILLIDDNNTSAMLWSAQASAVTGDIRQAADLYVRLIRYRPAIIQQMAEVARQLATLDRIDDARILYEKAMMASPENADIRKAWEQLVEKQGGDTAVRAAYDRLIVDSHNDLQIYDLYTDYLKRVEDWPAVVAIREKTLEVDPHYVPSLLDLANASLREGNFEKAEPYFNRAIETNDADPEVYRQIAQAFIAAQKYDRAAELFQRSLALNPNDIESMVSLALLNEKIGKSDEAEKQLIRALELSPANPLILKQLGSHYLRGGDRRKAAELYSQSINTKQNDISTWLALSQLYFEDDKKSALDDLEKLADARLTEYPDFYAQYGRLAQMFGDFERSRKALEKGIKATPGDLGMRAALARAYAKLGLPDQAIKSLNDADPYIKDSEALRQSKDQYLASLYMELKKYPEAQKIWQSLSKATPDDFDLREQLISSLSKQGKEDAAKEEVNRVVREFGATKPLETQLFRAAIYRNQGDPARAVGVLKQLVADNPDNNEVWFQLALSASDADDLDLAEQYYKKLIAAGPAETNQFYETSSNNLGYMLAQKGVRLDEALALVKQAEEANPGAAYILDSLGWVYYQKADYPNSRIYLEKAAKRSFGDAEVFTNLGQLYEKIDENDLARESYDKALEADPTLKRARERRDALAAPKETPVAATQ